MGQAVKVKSVEHLTHDVLRIVAEKPSGLIYIPGQAVDVTINKEGWKEETRPFTFVSLPEDNEIEFNTKVYTDHKGVTNELQNLKAGDELIIGEVFGDIRYKGEGMFIAGGAGITPFLAILKDLKRKGKLGKNKLMFANKMKNDVIREAEFKEMLGANFISVLSNENIEGHEHGFVTAELIKKYSGPETKYYYLCGPPPMMDAVRKHFKTLGIPDEFIITEGF